MKKLLINFLKAPEWVRFSVVSVIASLIFILLFALFNLSAKHILLKSVIYALVLSFYGTYIKRIDYKIPKNYDDSKNRNAQ